RPCLLLLLVGQGHRPQGQDLVDLGRVEQVLRALGRHRRVVVEDDRRGEQHLPVPGLAGQDRPGVVVLTGLGGRLGPLRRVEQRHERRPRGGGQRGGGGQDRKG